MIKKYRRKQIIHSCSRSCARKYRKTWSKLAIIVTRTKMQRLDLKFASSFFRIQGFVISFDSGLLWRSLTGKFASIFRFTSAPRTLWKTTTWTTTSTNLWTKLLRFPCIGETINMVAFQPEGRVFESAHCRSTSSVASHLLAATAFQKMISIVTLTIKEVNDKR